MNRRVGSRRGERGERGAVIVFAGLILTAMLGFAAFVVDIANATQVRRQAQNTVDASALAGAQDLPDSAKVVATVKSYAQKNLNVATSAWSGCSDSDALANKPDAGNGNTCISIDEAFEKVRVKLPTRQVGTYFGGVLGVKTIAVTADAVAEA
jgi:uncharacterized membrane protein